jgi:excinuclease UvrABC ATPase subunit
VEEALMQMVLVMMLGDSVQWEPTLTELTIAQNERLEGAARLLRITIGRLSRPAPTLSGGEAQRIRLAAQLGSNLQGVCYVLDEPTIGLHPRDNEILLDSLAELTSHRNTLVVVEHDEETIRTADWVLDIGPGAGEHGGEVISNGSLAALLAEPRSITGAYLRGERDPRQTDRLRRHSPEVALDKFVFHVTAKKVSPDERGHILDETATTPRLAR